MAAVTPGTRSKRHPLCVPGSKILGQRGSANPTDKSPNPQNWTDLGSQEPEAVSAAAPSLRQGRWQAAVCEDTGHLLCRRGGTLIGLCVLWSLRGAHHCCLTPYTPLFLVPLWGKGALLLLGTYGHGLIKTVFFTGSGACACLVLPPNQGRGTRPALTPAPWCLQHHARHPAGAR